jgi:hypothetical protein
MVKCLIWETDANEHQPAGDALRFNSPRAGGEYLITGTAVSMLRFEVGLDLPIWTDLGDLFGAGLVCGWGFGLTPSSSVSASP